MGEKDYTKYGEQYWKDYNKKFKALLGNATKLSRTQDQANRAFADKEQEKKQEERIFDVHLHDSKRFKKYGDWISHDHHNMFKKYEAGKIECPVFGIAFPAIKRGLYAQKVNRTKDSKKSSKDWNLNLMPFQQAYDQFIEEYLMPVFEHQDKRFTLDQVNIPVIRKLVSYFTRQEDSELQIKRGVCLYGHVGTGKTTIMKQLSKFTIDNNLETIFHFIYMDDVYSGCSINGLEHLKDYQFKACAFDDIGMRAEVHVNSYGTKINAYQELVRSQYNRFSRPNPSLSHYTTNLPYNSESDKKELARNFGARELDRFRHMCNFVALLGSSRRDYL